MLLVAIPPPRPRRAAVCPPFAACRWPRCARVVCGGSCPVVAVEGSPRHSPYPRPPAHRQAGSRPPSWRLGCRGALGIPTLGVLAPWAGERQAFSSWVSTLAVRPASLRPPAWPSLCLLSAVEATGPLWDGEEGVPLPIPPSRSVLEPRRPAACPRAARASERTLRPGRGLCLLPWPVSPAAWARRTSRVSPSWCRPSRPLSSTPGGCPDGPGPPL